MLSILRAFAWLRWRMVMNAFDKPGGRDRLERVSMAVEQILPVLAVLLLLPTALGLGGLGVFFGYSIAQADLHPTLMAVVRFLLLAVPILAIVGPFVLPAADRTNPVRLLLLPIPRATLYVAQSSSAFGDPWTLLAIPLIFGIAIGLIGGGVVATGVLALVAAVLFVLILVGLSSLAASLLHLIVRDRRRGELIALLLIVVLPLIGMLPAMMASRAARDRPASPLAQRVRTAAVAMAPSEMYLKTVRGAAAGDTSSLTGSLAALAGVTGVLHLLGFVAFRKVLESPGSSGGKRGAPMRDIWTRRIPGLSAPASAVALAQLRLALRTPRGRSIMLSPLVVFLLFGVMMFRSKGGVDMGPFQFTSGIGLATTCAFFAVISLLPIAMNQFAIDRAGLTLALLSPLREEELLAGKAVGNALIIGPPALACIVVSRVVFPGDPITLWVALILGLAAMYTLVTPVAAIGSAVFPRVANLNSIGRGGNPHGMANLIGILSLMLAGVIPFGLVLACTKLLDRPALAPLLVGLWCAVAFAVARLLFIPAVRVFHNRRENLSMLE